MAVVPLAKDLSNIRGFNYQSAATKHHTEHWLEYNPAHTAFELDLAGRLNLNQARVFITYDAYIPDPKTFLGRLRHLADACDQRDIGLMVTMMYPRDMVADAARWPVFRGFASDLVETLAGHLALAFWDVSNEPDWGGERLSPEQVRMRMDHARFMADLFHELDTVTPVTIGATFVPGMEAMADSMDVLSFHDYSPTRAEIRANIERAKQFAARVGKPVINTEIGCLCRANPYDITLEEHMRAGIGWYIWELMVTGQWGTVHGVFYQDGTVRDPSIAAAVMGFFRHRGPNAIPSELDREGHVRRFIDDSREWLEQAEPGWEEGLRLAETAAHLLEAGELVPMRELPTRAVYALREGAPDRDALGKALREYIRILEPHVKD
jgi:hypothetical protein